MYVTPLSQHTTPRFSIKHFNIQHIHYVLLNSCDGCENICTLSYYYHQSEVWIISGCLGLSHETMVCTKCLVVLLFSYTLSHEYLWWEIDILGCYSPVKIAFAPICACKNNRRIWRHNASTPCSHDVIGQLWWRHKYPEKIVLSDNGEIGDR